MIISIDTIDWTALFQISLIAGMILVVFQLHTAEKLEALIPYREAKHGALGFLRRVSMLFKGLAMAWCADYGHNHGWMPWPPVVALVLALDFYILVRILIMYQDIRAHREGRREVRYYEGKNATGRTSG